MNNGRRINRAITLDPALPALVAEASREPGGYIGFYFEFDDSEGDDGEWGYWTSDAADATATNKYYTPQECGELLVALGFHELV